MLYQICVLDKASKSTPQATVRHTTLVEADNIMQATAHATDKHDRASIRVYPYCTPQDGAAQLELARHTLKSVENWERRNNNAALEPYRRSAEDREDYIMIACVAISAIFATDPYADMHTLKTAAFAAIRREQTKHSRRREIEYLPGWSACNMTPPGARATYPALCRLVRRAIEAADMTDNQARVLNMAYQDGQGAQDIADALGITRATVYQTLYRAYCKVLAQMVELDRDLRAAGEAGITAEDIDVMQAILRRRARW